jgi:hypothetical protein
MYPILLLSSSKLQETKSKMLIKARATAMETPPSIEEFLSARKLYGNKGEVP